MEINAHDDGGLLEIWLTREERADQALRARVRELSRRYSGQKYAVAVFLSGAQDLAGETGALLCHNRRRAAERALRREDAPEGQAWERLGER